MCQPKSHGTRIRCPELDTGANSVSPWVMPRIMACSRVRVGLLVAGQTAREGGVQCYPPVEVGEGDVCGVCVTSCGPTMATSTRAAATA